MRRSEQGIIHTSKHDRNSSHFDSPVKISLDVIWTKRIFEAQVKQIIPLLVELPFNVIKRLNAGIFLSQTRFVILQTLPKYIDWNVSTKFPDVPPLD
jgi:hypothetical protein